MTKTKKENMKRISPRYSLYDVVKVKNKQGVIVGVFPKRKYAYYDVVFEDYKYGGNDWGVCGIEFENVREDEIEKELEKPKENTRGYLVEGEPCPFCKGTGKNQPNLVLC